MAPTAKVLAYKQGFLALNFSDAEAAAFQNRSRDGWWMKNKDGTAFVWGGGNCNYAYGNCNARVINATIPEVRQWFVQSVALPSLASDAVAGFFVDNAMELGVSAQTPWRSVELQRAAAQMHRELGEAILKQFPGKRALLSLSHSLYFTDLVPPPPPPAPPEPASDFAFITAAAVNRSECSEFGVGYFEDTILKTKSWIPRPNMGCVNFSPGAAQKFKAVPCSVVESLANGPTFSCSMLPGYVPPPPAPPVLMREEELTTYWRDIPWGRYYDNFLWEVGQMRSVCGMYAICKSRLWLASRLWWARGTRTQHHSAKRRWRCS